MKSVILFFLFMFAIVKCTAQGVFFIDKQTGSVSLENVVNNVLSTNAPVSGQTYSVNKQNYAIKTGNNSDVSVFLSNDVYLRVKESTHLTFDVFDQDFSNLDGLPSKTQYTSFVNSLSLINGELEIVSNQNGSTDGLCTISTSLVSVILTKGKYVISADTRTTIIIVLDGSATILDNSSKKKEVVKSKNTAVIVPAPKFQGHGVETMVKRNNIFTIKETNNGDGESYLLNVNSIEESSKQFRFISIDKVVRGVRIN